APILRRAGARRRRGHTALGAAVAVASVVLTGALVTDAAGVRPTLGREHPQADREHQLEVVAAALPDTTMLGADQVGNLLPGGTWRVASTNDNSVGNGLVLPCQQERYADPDGTAALIRTFASTPDKKTSPAMSAIQSTEASATKRAARTTYLTSVGWYAGCVDERVQLLATRRVTGVGDAAMLLALRTWDTPQSTLVVGVARTGQVTTTTMTRIGGIDTLPLVRSARMLSAAVDGLCGLPDAGRCAGVPHSVAVPPLPIGVAPGMLAEVDLPPVRGVSRPWVGTEPQRARENVAATRCDDADFEAKGITHDLTRSFLIPGANLPVEFGLTETVGSMPAKQAIAFVAAVRSGLARCPSKNLGTDVTRVSHLQSKSTDLTIWHLTSDITDKMSVRYLMAIVRSGTAVAQIQFVPSGDVEMADGAFAALAERALERLPRLPGPG
ncbi:hypothetical protein, partial [Nocardioides sp.]|uniref:hypothetical protein n=1 Tax=Nocardioides sp. TaxID=35761 RepID=UPI0031FEE67A|nr:hypothetical protein [Nocardioides sp.]